ncbi:Phosphopantothenoylcysteine decarboxylase, partial [Eschrichtius robustus]|nr:Phosphopantothenoylcysteine decarboxylase [Eschrichtius robustus]
PHVVWGVGVGETAHVGRAVEPPSIRLCGGAHIPLILWVDSSPESLDLLSGLEVAVVTTERAKHFYSPQDVPVTLYSDADEWEMWKCRSDPVLHIDLRRWADLMLVAPLDANTLGKVASGICDNLLFMGCPQHALLLVSLPSPVACPPYLCLPTRTWISTWTCVIRAWDRSKPLLFCPAMNTAMWEHPVTEQQVGQLKAFGYVEIPCVVKKLVCGDQELRSSQGGPFGGSGTQAGAHWRASVVRVQAKVEMHCHVLDVGYLDGILDSMC